MPDVALFGRTFAVTTAGNDHPVDGATLHLQLNGALDRLTIALNGTVGALAFQAFQAGVQCVVAGNEVRIAAGNVPWTGDIHITMGGASAPVGLTTVIAPAPEPGFGIAFATTQAAAQRQAIADGGRGILKDYAELTTDWTSTILSIDAASATAPMWPVGGASGMKLADRFGPPRDPKVRQAFTLERLRLLASGFEVQFWPDNGAIFLNPDILDPTRRSDGESNAFLYQHVAGGAHLVGSYVFSAGRWQNGGWFLDPAASGGAIRLAVPALKDEQGHPLIFSLRERLPLASRNGHIAPQDNPLGVSNLALVIGDAKREKEFAAEMETLDPLELYGEARTPAALVNQFLQAPYWVKGRDVALQGARPREILGIASDASLVIDSPGVSGPGPRRPQPVKLSFAPLADNTLGLRFMYPTVEVPLTNDGPATAVYAMDLPEKEAFERLPNGTIRPAISRRKARAERRSVTLPFLDMSWALANLGSDGTGKSPADEAASWLNRLDKDARAVFGAPEPTGYEHREGMRAAPNTLPVMRMLTQPPASTRGPDSPFDAQRVALPPTVLREPEAGSVALRPARAAGPQHAAFLFGGPESPQGLIAATAGDPLKEAAKRLEAGRRDMRGPLEDFFWFWVGEPRGSLPAKWQEARLALRDYLVGLRPALSADPEQWTFDELVEASERLEAARCALASNPAEALGFSIYEDLLADALPDEVAELVDPDRGTGLLDRLLQYAFAPPTMELANRALAALAGGALPDHDTVLKKFVSDELRKAVDEIFKGAGVPEGLLAELLQGVPPIFELAQCIWRDPSQLGAEAAEILRDLVERYGPELTRDVYVKLLEDAQDSDAFAGVLRDLGYPLARLADLAGEPPDYLIVSRQLRRPASGDPNDDPARLHPVERVAALWNHRFDFCAFGGGKAWDMFFDDRTTLIFKLGGTRGLEAILKEATAAYATAGRKDPFALDPAGSANAAAAFASILPDDVAAADWRGLLVINPTVDLERDEVLSTLCGFTHIAARFAAIGGRAPDGHIAKLDVWGRIEKTSEASGWTDEDGKSVPAAPSWGGGDVGWSLMRFYATVRGTTILSADIAFRLDIRELLGRRRDWDPITVAGTLPPTSGAVTGNPRDFTFSATFDTPMKLDVEVGFLERVLLHSIRVGSHDGDTVLDIDADLEGRDWDMGGLQLKAPKLVELNDFRIRVPKVKLGRAVSMGLSRPLKFDLGAIRIPVADGPRVTLAGLDIRPVGVGLIRGTPAKVRERLHAETVPLVEPFGNAPADQNYAYPYIDTRVEFGRTPALDGGGEFSLVARVGVPVSSTEDPISKPRLWRPGVGLSSLSGRDLKISLFRLLTIEFEAIEAGIFNLEQGQKAGAIWAEGFNLSILSWRLFKKEDDPANKSARTLLYAHEAENARRRGFLAWYANPKPGSGFFRLQWLLVAQNVDPGKTLKDGLLALSGSDLKAEMAAIRALKSGDSLKVKLEDGSKWLLGIRFELGDLFKPCVLLFHDGSYYGIRLGGPIAKLITGEDDISLAYIPGERPALDRFRVAMRIAALDMMGPMRSGEIALEWSPAWDFLLDFGQPWRGPQGYMWERAFSVPMGIYEARFGFFVEKRTSVTAPAGLPPAPAGDYVTFSAGAGFYYGYQFSAGNSVAWVRAGIGIFGVLIGSATLRLPAGGGGNPLALLKTSLARLEIAGVLGVYAYGEGGVDVWILSARFRVSAQAFVQVELVYIPSARSYLTYEAMLAAHYSASVKVGSGWFSWTFRVSGSVQMRIAGSASFG